MNKQNPEQRERAVLLGKFDATNKASGVLLYDDGEFVAASSELDGAVELFQKEIAKRLLKRANAAGTRFELTLTIVGEPIQEALEFPS